VGDLACHTRGAASELDSFERIGGVLATRATGGEPLPMHCDVVVKVDERGFDTIGGNVLQSVTRRRLDFAPGTRTLDPSYYLPMFVIGGTIYLVALGVIHLLVPRMDRADLPEYA
jgi:hypothetical protein